ncbi:MAG: hypothetical protein K2L05_02635 [Muribaculaceae bacterium]|nr:hypothetical protein [Muribaculaceae bacterium]
MKTFKQLLLAAALTVSSAGFAAEYQWLTFRMADNTELSVAAENLAISYSGRELRLKSATVDRTLAVDAVKSMRFTSDPAAIDAPQGATRAAAGDYFTAAGVKVGSFASADEARRTLPSGVYVVKTGNKTFKLIF